MNTNKSWSKTTEPSSYDQIYKYFEQVLDECSTFINEIENEYYEGITSSINFSSKNQSPRRSVSVNALLLWSRPLNELRNARALHDIRNGKAVRELLAEAKSGNLVGPIPEESFYLLQRILDKTNEQLYSKLPILVDRIADCMNLMQQYFLSFYDIENIQEIIQKKKKEKLPVSIRRFSKMIFNLFL